MHELKSGFISIVGKTNVGKSTLLNYLSNEKIAIITSKPQTTRTAIRAIINTETAQMIFIDTPGIHTPKNKLGKVMIETATTTISDVDIILFLIDATNNGIIKENEMILEKLKKEKKKAILVINKIDLVKKEKLLRMIDCYQKEYSFEAIIPMSSLKGKGKEELLLEIEKCLPAGPKYYDDEEFTDQTTRQLIEEIIREKALKFLDQEIPHGIYIEVSKMKSRKTMQNEKIFDIDGTIYCMKTSHKGIIIGKNGEMLKKIGKYARQDIEKMMQSKVNLKLWVKVEANWLEKNSIINRFKAT